MSTASFLNFTVTYSSQAVVMTGDGGGQWVINTGLLAGQPTLSVRELQPNPSPPGGRAGGPPSGGILQRHTLTVTLSNSRYAGTQLLADLTITIAEIVTFDDTTTTVHVNLALGNASFFWSGADFGSWLDGSGPVTAPVSVSGPAISLGSNGQVTFGAGSSATASLSPRSLILQGQGVCSLAAFGVTSPATSLSVALLDPTPRTTCVLQLTGPVAIPLRSPTPVGSLTPQPGFNTLTLNTTETASDAIFTSTGLTAQYLLELPAGVTDTAGGPLRFQLQDGAVIFIINDASKPPVSLVARGKPLSTPILCAGLGMSIPASDGPGVLQLQLAFNGTAWTVIQAVLPLPGLFVPLADGISEPASPSAAQLSLVPGGANWIALGAVPGGQPRVHIEDFAVHITRPADLLTLEISTSNMALEASDGAPPTLGPVQNGQFTFWRVRFPPQHIAERAFYRASEQSYQPPLQGDDPLSTPVDARAAGPTQLAFLVPPTTPRFPVTLANLLDWRAYEQAGTVLDNPGEAYNPPPALQPPDPLRQTSIEVPHRLFLSLDNASGWSHATTTPADVAELWHTRLAARKSTGPSQFVVDERPAAGPRHGRAFWSPDFQTPADAFPTSLDGASRRQIVQLTASANPAAHTFDVKELFLSAMGATVHVEGHWDPLLSSGLDLTLWQHATSLGRDELVRVGHRGFVAPYGHRATHVTVCERRFVAPTDGAQAVAYLVRFDYIIITEPLRTYDALDLPFTQIEFLTRITPPLNQPQPLPGAEAFWISANNSVFQFELRGVDHLGRQVTFRAPALFVPDDATFDSNTNAALGEFRNNTLLNRPIDCARQKVGFASSDDAENTSFEVATISLTSFDARPAGSTSWQQGGVPLFRPTLNEASIHHSAAAALGSGADTLRVEYFTGYLQASAQVANGADVFLTFAQPVPQIQLGADKTGIAAPGYPLTAISRARGAVPGAVKDIVLGVFEPAFLPPTATFLGNIPLQSLIAAQNKIPNLHTVRDTAPDGTPLLVTTFAWSPNLITTAYRLDPLVLTFDGASKLDLTASVTTRLAASADPPVSHLHGQAGAFTLQFADLIAVHFASMTFDSITGHKPTVDVKLQTPPIEFQGDLEFVNTLRELIPSNGFSPPALPDPTLGPLAATDATGPFLDVTASGVTAGYSLAIPSVSIGIFSLENIRLGAALNLPFAAQPVSLDFHFAERDHKFLLSVDLLSGGGYFAISVDASGIQRLEFAIEFGANVALNLFVASGSAHILAGAGLMYGANASNTLSGYLRAGGELTILGLVSIAVDFYLSLSYETTTGDLYGIASLSVEVSVAFISKSVTVTLEKRFAGSGSESSAASRFARPLLGQPSGPPALESLFTDAEWAAYAAAFA